MNELLRAIDEIRERVDELLVENAELYRLADDAVDSIVCASCNCAVPSRDEADGLQDRLEALEHEGAGTWLSL